MCYENCKAALRSQRQGKQVFSFLSDKILPNILSNLTDTFLKDIKMSNEFNIKELETLFRNAPNKERLKSLYKIISLCFKDDNTSKALECIYQLDKDYPQEKIINLLLAQNCLLNYDYIDAMYYFHTLSKNLYNRIGLAVTYACKGQHYKAYQALSFAEQNIECDPESYIIIADFFKCFGDNAYAIKIEAKAELVNYTFFNKYDVLDKTIACYNSNLQFSLPEDIIKLYKNKILFFDNTSENKQNKSIFRHCHYEPVRTAIHTNGKKLINGPEGRYLWPEGIDCYDKDLK